MKLRNFCFYTMTFKSPCANVMVDCYSLSTESRVQNLILVLHVQHELSFFKTGSTCIEPHDRNNIVSMARLSTEECGQAIGMLRAGRSQTTVSRILRCSRSSISRLWLKFQQTGKSFSAISFRPSLLCFFVLITFLCHN